MEPSSYNYPAQYVQPPAARPKRSVFMLIATAVIVLLAVALFVNHFLSQKTLTIQPAAGYSVTIGTPTDGENGPAIGHILFTTSKSTSVRLSSGNYVAMFSASSGYQPVSEAFDLSKSVTLTSPKLDYTAKKLASLLQQESATIHAAFQTSSSGSLLANGYSIQDGGLFLDGTWYAGKLIPASTTSSDIMAFVMQEVNGSWKLVTTPALSLYIGSYPNIPKIVIEAANNTPTTVTNSASGGSSNATPVAAQIPSGVLATANEYLQAREDSIGDDQTSQSSWLNGEKPLTTASFFSTLQQDSGTSYGDYYTAHSDGFDVKANVSGCTWSSLSSTEGTLNCSLSDETISVVSGADAAPASIPFGWTHIGPQPAVALTFVEQGSTWLINNDSLF